MKPKPSRQKCSGQSNPDPNSKLEIRGHTVIDKQRTQQHQTEMTKLTRNLIYCRNRNREKNYNRQLAIEST